MATFLLCSISKKTAECPVVCTKTGLVFEKSTIEKHIDINGTCPITGEKIDAQDLVQIRSISEIREDVASTSLNSDKNNVPELIHKLKSDWDSVALESNSLKQHLYKLRKELSHTLYQQDASCRVISRLIKERDEARR